MAPLSRRSPAAGPNLGPTVVGLREAVSDATYARGSSYALRGNVVDIRWDEAAGELLGRVRGSGLRPYSTIVRFEGDGASRRFGTGLCSCPVGADCKHVVALVLAAGGDQAGGGPAASASSAARAATQALETLAAAARRAGTVSVGVNAARPGTARKQPGAAATQRPARRAAAPPSWERSLGELLELKADDDPHARHGAGWTPPPLAGATPLAVELSLVSDAGADPRVTARLVRQGRTGWVNAVSWDQLTAWHHVTDYAPAHVQLLREMFALSRARQSSYPYGYRQGDGRRLDLSTFDSRALWALLDEAETVGLRFVHGRKKLGDVAPYRHGELVLDVTREPSSDDGRGGGDGGGPGALTIVPVLRLDGELAPQLAPFCFIGENGHGVVYVDRAEARATDDRRDWHIHLARLAEPVAPPLRRMTLEGRRLVVPAAGQGRFLAEFYPRLRRLAPVVSSDGSFDVPEVSPPTLVLRAAYGDDHDLDLFWEWAYEIGGEEVRAPLLPAGPPGGTAAEGDLAAGALAGPRDVRAEQRVLAALDLPPAAAELLAAATEAAEAERFLAGPGDAPGVAGQSSLPAPGTARLRGAETMRVTTEVLPLLAGRPGLRVEVEGEAADYREAGDSLRIALSVDDVEGDNDWFDLGVTITVEGRQVSFRDLFVALDRGDEYLLLPDGAYFSLEKPELAALRRLIEEARALGDWSGESPRISRFQAGLWEELATLGVVERQAAAWREQVGGLLAVTAPRADLAAPAALAATLRPYQLDGFRWLAFLWENRLGGILADDMGLGKTLQTLALICHARETATAAATTGATTGGATTTSAAAATPADAPEGADASSSTEDGPHPAAGPAQTFAPFLVVAPTSVVANWATEARRFAPDLRAVTIVDTAKRRGAALRDVAAGADIVVTSYTLFRLEIDDYATLDWSALVLDEAQMVKNHQSKAYQCARRLPAPFKLAITGTPMENNLMELWSLLSITAPGLFPNPARFRDYYAQPIERRHDPELLARLRGRIRPLMLRRTKEQAAPELPLKQEQVLEVDLHPRHRRLYQTHLQRERQKVLGLVSDLGRNRFTILRSLTLLRQLSLHAGLVDDDHADLPSAKIESLLEQLTDVVGGGHRALVFSQFTGFLGKIRDRLAAAGVEYCYLDGKTRDRATVVERFKSGDASVFLVSLKAGGFGLNLTEADYCFLLDPWWNPATEAQAVDRTHRIGQTRNVMVYRLVARDTIEDKVMSLAARKAHLFTSVIDDGAAFGATLTEDDVRHLFD
ncbi:MULTISPECIES: DEAD/DEAH box helicase [unclassified Pseudofrankia]|uniref:DEAD/DEAH box helicase n=1 Tax=unclassified Pseudofrankia TaxID=2994372 RepID=UPI0009F7048D|nr:MULTISPECIES: DEAD/DEAH box helicase [unclassified Pseudofrankia]MDT3440375.1 DEAD/DEAH box helicase [Pseudofrankia sp. BMG5.37]